MRGNLNFRRLAFSGVGISVGFVLTVTGFMAKMRGAWALSKSVPAKWPFFREL